MAYPPRPLPRSQENSFRWSYYHHHHHHHLHHHLQMLLPSVGILSNVHTKAAAAAAATTEAMPPLQQRNPIRSARSWLASLSQSDSPPLLLLLLLLLPSMMAPLVVAERSLGSVAANSEWGCGVSWPDSTVSTISMVLTTGKMASFVRLWALRVPREGGGGGKSGGETSECLRNWFTFIFFTEA